MVERGGTKKEGAGEPAPEGVAGCWLSLERQAQTEEDHPRTVELAVHYAEGVWILEIQTAGTVLTRIGELHVVQRVQELRVEGC